MSYKLESVLLGEMVNHLKYGDDTTLMVESEEELKNHLMRVEKESEEASVKLSIKKQTKIIASSPFTSLQIEGEKVETVTDFLFLGSKITADGDCSHEFIRRLLLGRKAMMILDSVLRNRHYSENNSLYSQGYAFRSGHVRL